VCGCFAANRLYVAQMTTTLVDVLVMAALIAAAVWCVLVLLLTHNIHRLHNRAPSTTWQPTACTVVPVMATRWVGPAAPLLADSHPEAVV
jgi:hypothetical protein